MTTATPPKISAVSTRFDENNFTTPKSENTSSYGVHGILVGVFFGSFSLLTISGNLLVIVAVLRMRYLRSMTNYFIVSLAVADLLMGSVVMPFAVITEATNGYWPFGQDWCDLWHAFDVLSSTASILNLCMIAVERFWATDNPFTYPSKMTKKRCLLMVATVWVCSSGISFPAIIWWRATGPVIDPNSTVCEFPDDRSYLFISSTISFYVPLMVMIFVYYRIFKTANDLIRSLNSGTKVIYKNGSKGEMLTLRIHRGGAAQSSTVDGTTAAKSGGVNNNKTSAAVCAQQHKEPPQSKKTSPAGQQSNPRGFSALSNFNSNYSASRMAQQSAGEPPLPEPSLECQQQQQQERSTTGANKYISKKIKSFAFGKRLTKFAREQKAAKTLGIVMGIFIICWLPFFTCIIIIAVDKEALGDNVGQIFTVVTWLGYANSSVNPIIYAHSMRDFRRAFIKILCSCCSRLRKREGRLGGDSFLADIPKKSRSGHTLSSSTRTCTSRRNERDSRIRSVVGGVLSACWQRCPSLAFFRGVAAGHHHHHHQQQNNNTSSPRSFSMSQTDQELYGFEVEPIPKTGLNLSSPHIALGESE